MRIASVLTALFLILVNIPFALAQDNADSAHSPIVVPSTETYDLTSETNGHDYRLWIGLPENYTTSEESYPVLYLLDPHISFLSATEFVRVMAWDETLPKILVVGIGYPTDDIEEIGVLRERDYYSRDDDFLKFIAEELIPLIDSTYRTDPADRAIAGFSYGGDFVFHVIAKNTELFNRYIAIEGSLGDLIPYLMRSDDAFDRLFGGREVKLFIAAVGDEILSLAIQRQEVEGLEVTGMSLGDVTHREALHLSLPAGLLAIYED